MQIDGACMCGYLSYEADIDPEKVMICHCTDCQTAAGSYRAGVMVDVVAFRLLTGVPAVYQKIAASGGRRALSFCPRCGTSLHGANVDSPQTYSLRLGTVRQRAQLVPKLQIWCRSALPWTFDLDAIPKIENQPGLKL